jgi:hypothetical protein
MNDSARTELKSREIAKLLEVVEETYLCQKGAPEYGVNSRPHCATHDRLDVDHFSSQLCRCKSTSDGS